MIVTMDGKLHLMQLYDCICYDTIGSEITIELTQYAKPCTL